ncbi:uncharacterized protein LOC111518477 [Drosophila willistoni]|uniref:uncharacterized protein LOC111518477 n=1 Tax=Drosophila willistoni TaxID=7260 RepID=UPI00017D7139|nr:uncharacterized protein LOC111518477 [Drosophila willistoni]
MPRPILVEEGKGKKSKKAEKVLSPQSAKGKIETVNSKETEGNIKAGKDEPKDGGNKNQAGKKEKHVMKKKMVVLADVDKEVVVMVGNGAMKPTVEEQFGKKVDKPIVMSKEEEEDVKQDNPDAEADVTLFMNDIFNQISDPLGISVSKKLKIKQEKPKHKDMLNAKKKPMKPLWVLDTKSPPVPPQNPRFPDVRLRRHYGLPRKSKPLTNLFKDLSLWRSTLLTVAHVFLGVLLLNTLNSYALIVLLAKTGLFILMNGFFYGSWRQQLRFRPYEKLIVCDIEISPEWLQTVVRNLNDLLMVIQKILFNDNILVAICLWLCLMEIRNLFNNVDGLTIFTYTYLGIFLAPRVYIDMKALINQARREAQLPADRRSKTFRMRLLVNFIKPFEPVWDRPKKRPPVKTIYVNRGQQTDAEDDVTKERNDLSATIAFAIEQQCERIIVQREEDPREPYSLWHILGVLTTISMPNYLKYLVYWENSVESGIYLITGLYLLTCHHTYIQTFSLVILIEFTLLLIYSCLRQVIIFGPFELFLNWKAKLPEERTTNMTRTVVNWINRWIATIQYILFSRNLFAALGVWMWLYEMRKMGNSINGQTLLIYVYLCFFLVPVLRVKLMHTLHAWRNTTNVNELTSCLNYAFMILDLFEFPKITNTTGKRTICVNRGQQTESSGGFIQEKDHLQLITAMASFDPIASSLRFNDECGLNASQCLFTDYNTNNENETLSA